MADWLAYTGWALFLGTGAGWWAQSHTTETWRSIYYSTSKVERSWRRMFFETRAGLWLTLANFERSQGHDDLADWCDGRRAHWEELAKNVD